MERKYLKLEALKIKSFVTLPSINKVQTIKAGGYIMAQAAVRTKYQYIGEMTSSDIEGTTTRRVI